MQVDGTSLGIQFQGGDSRFLNRYALRTHGAYDPAAAMRFALEHQNPLVAARVTGGLSGELHAAPWSLVSLPSPDNIKPDSNGRLWVRYRFTPLYQTAWMIDDLFIDPKRH